jgi:hypothetical protein
MTNHTTGTTPAAGQGGTHDCPAVDDLAALRAAVTGLAREVEGLRRSLIGAASAAELARVADLVTDLSQIITASGVSPEPPSSWLALPADDNPDAAGTLLADLIGWIGQVYLRYTDAARGLPQCWLWHPDVVEELLWLRGAWHSAYQSGEASVRAAGDWHDRLRPGVARRIADYTRACSLESHLPDRATGAPAVPMAQATEQIAAWWANHRAEPGPIPTNNQLQAAAAAARTARGGAR